MMTQEREMGEFPPFAGAIRAKTEMMGLMQVCCQIWWAVYEDLPM